MKSVRALTTLAAFALAACLSAEEASPKAAAGEQQASQQVSRPKTEAFVDDVTGVEFPPEIAGFVKTQVVKNSNPYYGTVVRYAAADGSCADVYIYSLGQPLDAELLKAHFQGVLRVISRLPGSASSPVKALSFKSQTDVKLAKGAINAKKAVFSFEAAGGVFESELALFACKDNVVKIRISRPHGARTPSLPFEENVALLCEKAIQEGAAARPATPSQDAKANSQAR